MLFRKFPKTVDTFDNTENPKDVSDIPLNKENRKQSDAHENPNPNPKPQYSRRVFQSYRYLQSRLHQKTLTIPISSPPKEPKEFENHNVVFKIFVALKLQQPRQGLVINHISGYIIVIERIVEMGDNKSSSGPPKENPDNDSDANPLAKDDSSLETIVRKFQDSMSLKKHKFWETQPVGQFKEVGDSSLPEGPIEPPTPLSEVKQEPYNLPTPYEWTTCDMDSEETCLEVYNLLKNNYVEDDENMFRFNYSKEFLRWALRPPSYFRSWHIGVRAKSSKKLKLIDVGFSRLGARMTMSRTIKLYKLPDSPVTPGFRKMELRDVPAVTRLLRNYLSQFVVAPDFDEDDVEHWLLPSENVVDSYLVESPETHEITDFCSFYTLPSSILGNQTYSTLKAAYSYYNVSTKTPLLQLMNDALIVAKQKDYDVFNALDVMQNESFLKELKFGPGDGQLHYYLYNYRIRCALKPSELGLYGKCCISPEKTKNSTRPEVNNGKELVQDAS
ncbi:glycylpeptide n-tetradecanoyltransferase 1 [Quercus suber]|uniref:Glycylpeptide N-tetradecanoyltransferase n=1 Tax=Quercus suber TaxID=58331 RepID=A0AAW0KP55_QUESU